jgi:hypothetical protein
MKVTVNLVYLKVNIVQWNVVSKYEDNPNTNDKLYLNYSQLYQKSSETHEVKIFTLQQQRQLEWEPTT